MPNVDTLPKKDHTELYGSEVTRPTLHIPVALWREVRKSAADLNVTLEQYTIDALRERLERKKVRRAS